MCAPSALAEDIERNELQVTIKRNVHECAADCDPGVEHHHVRDSAHAIDGFENGSVSLFRREIGLHRDYLDAHLAQFVRSVIHAATGPGDDEIVAVLRKEACDFQSNSGRAAGNKCESFGHGVWIL